MQEYKCSNCFFAVEGDKVKGTTPWCRRFPVTPQLVMRVNQLTNQPEPVPIGITTPQMPDGIACGEYKTGIIDAK